MAGYDDDCFSVTVLLFSPIKKSPAEDNLE